MTLKLVKADDCAKQLRQIRVELDRLLGARRKSDYEIAVLIHRVWWNGLYSARHASFSAWVRTELGGMSCTYAQKYAKTIEAGFTREDFQRVGMSKLVRVLCVPEPLRASVLASAHVMTRAQIVDESKRARGSVVVKPEASLTLNGEVAASIIRLAETMGVTPQRYVELMVTARFQPLSRKKVS